MDKETLLEQISDNFNLSSDEAEAALLLLDTRAANLDLSLDEYIEAYHPAGFSQKDSGLNPEYKGYVQFLAQDAKAIIKTGKTADFSTFVHEQAHIFRRQLAGDLKAKAEKAFKVEGGKWTREQEEYFAIGFEEYIRLRMTSSEDLRQVFERGARCMQHIYNGLDRIIDLNPEIIKVYDELFTENRFHFKQDDFEKAVKDISENSLEKFKASHVYLGMTAPIYQEIGFERLPVMITSKHLKTVMQDWGSDTSANYHGLTLDIIAQIPEAIKKPLVIMQSQNKEHPEAIIAVVELKDKDNKPIIIPFSPNKKGYVNDIQVDINLAKTIYGKDNFNAFIQRAVQENRILFINEKSQVLAIPRVQFPSNQGSRLLYDNIARYRNIVKQKIPDFAKLFQADAENIENGKKMNRDTFYRSSYTDWHEVKTTPNRESDFRSGSYSEYWYTKEGVYRKSDHWGNVSSCKWPLDGQQIRGDVKIGFSKWSDFYDMDVPFKSRQEVEYDRYTIIAKKRPFDFEEQRQLDIRISKKMLADAQKIGNEDRINFLQEEIKMYESLTEKDFHAYKQPVWETLLFQTAETHKSEKDEIKKVKEQYIGTDTYLKAPNGADTNLTERQWLQVRTPSAKKWLGDWENTPESASKVLDENGEPRILYHGTDELFTEFKSKKIGKHGIDDGRGFYFTTDINYAQKFTQSDIILPVFLNLRREISLTEYTINRTQALSIIKELDKSLTVNGEHCFLLNYGDVDTEGIQALCREVLNLEYGASDNDVDFLGSLVNASGNETMVTKAAAEVLGSIGVRSPQNDGSCHFIVRESNQIKSATENIGSFDMRNNNILFQRSSYYSRETQKEKRAEDVNKIAGYFIKAIETNTAPWMKPWKSNEYLDDFNPVTKTTYKGINSVILPFIRENEFHSNDPRWYTFNNAKEQNFMVKKGAKATPIVFYGTIPIGKDGKVLSVDEEGKPIGDAVRFRSTLRFYKVFHASQLGVPQFDKAGNLLRDKTGEVVSKPIEAFEHPKVETIDFKPIASAEKLLQQSGARIYHDQSEKSFYNTKTDSIHLCPKEHYINESLYYGTALHELSHWTGSTQRLDRSLDTYGLDIESRAREELIAEIGSYALCKDLKLDFNPQNNVAYVQNWCEILRDKPDEIMKATHAALEAKEYIQGFERTREKTNEREKVKTGIIPDNLHEGKKEEPAVKKQTEFDFSEKKEPCYNPTNGKLYKTQEFENHMKAINSDDKRYLSQNEIIKLGFSIKSNARPILLKTEKEVSGKTQFNYELLYNGKDIAGLPPVVCREKDKAAVRQLVHSIDARRKKDYGMEIG